MAFGGSKKVTEGKRGVKYANQRFDNETESEDAWKLYLNHIAYSLA